MKKWVYNRKTTVLLIAILIVIIILVIIIVANTQKSKSQTSITTNTNSISTTEDELAQQDSDVWEYYAEEDAADQKALNDKYKGRDDVHRDSKGNVVTGACLHRCVIKSISPKAQMYYFNDDGVYDKKYKGTAVGDDLKTYYVKNGKVDTSFTGLISRQNYMRVFKNGVELEDYNGRVELEGGLIANCQNGAMLTYELGRPDGFVAPYKITVLD